MRRSSAEKMEMIRLVEQSDLSVRSTLRQLGIAPSTFYGWYQRYLDGGPDYINDPEVDMVIDRGAFLAGSLKKEKEKQADRDEPLEQTQQPGGPARHGVFQGDVGAVASVGTL